MFCGQFVFFTTLYCNKRNPATLQTCNGHFPVAPGQDLFNVLMNIFSEPSLPMLLPMFMHCAYFVMPLGRTYVSV
jgi:hypothetical protein